MASDRSARVVDTLSRVDPEFIELCQMLFGDAADPEFIYDVTFGKLTGPDPSDVHIPAAPAPTKRRKALALSALGAVGAGAAVAVKDLSRATGKARILPSAALGGDLLAGGEIASNVKTLVSGNRKSQTTAKRHGTEKLVRGHLTQQRRLVRETLESTRRRQQGVEKRVDADWAGEFSKLEDDKRIALGWASVCKVNGQPVVDRQGDYIDADDLEDVVYDYVQRSRTGGDMHARTSQRGFGKDDGRGLWFGLYDPHTDEPRKVADLVESVVITKDKKAAMGLPEDFPEGWWVGFRYHDDDVWNMIKSGERRGFSIHGSGLRKGVDYDELMLGGH